MIYTRLACVIGFTLLPISGMFYLRALFPSRYSPTQTILFQLPILLVYLPLVFLAGTPGFMQAQLNFGALTTLVMLYPLHRIFQAPLRQVCAYYFAYSLLSPYTLISFFFSLFPSLRATNIPDVRSLYSLWLYVLKVGITLVLSVIIIWCVASIKKRITLLDSIARWVHILMNTIYAGISIFVLYESHNNLRTFLQLNRLLIVVGVSCFIFLKLAFDKIDLVHLKKEHRRLKAQRELQFRYFSDLQTHESAISKLRHDTMGHLQTLQVLAEDATNERLERYLKQLIKQYEEKNV